MRKVHCVAVWFCLLASPALAVTVPGSDGSDGALDATADMVIDLSLAADAAWDTPSPTPGNGVYDGAKWTVVFKYSSVNIPAGVTVSFVNHPKRAPVVWLVEGQVVIDGTVVLTGEGQTGSELRPAESGPGGFRGGRGYVGSVPGSGGYGPGGGDPYDGSGSYGTVGEGTNPGPVYGNVQVLPLIGGSGASRGYLQNSGGGGGGGAILIASEFEAPPEQPGELAITINGQINANGGNEGSGSGPGGSGGGIRLIAESVGGSGSVQAVGGGGNRDGGSGRIRVEADSVTLASFSPDPSIASPSEPAELWPGPGSPAIEAKRFDYLDAQGAPQTCDLDPDPTASLEFPYADCAFETNDPVTLWIEAANVPLGWTITLRVVPRSGDPIETTATLDSGDETLSTWSATFDLPGGFAAMQIRGDAP